MWARAFWTVLPWGSSTAFLGVMMILAFIETKNFAENPATSEPKSYAPDAPGASKHYSCWQWSRCDHSATQRSVGAAESFACLLRGFASRARCAGRRSRSATPSTNRVYKNGAWIHPDAPQKRKAVELST